MNSNMSCNIRRWKTFTRVIFIWMTFTLTTSIFIICALSLWGSVKKQTYDSASLHVQLGLQPQWKSSILRLQTFSIMAQNLIRGIVPCWMNVRGMGWGHSTKASPLVQRWARTWAPNTDSSWSGENLLKVRRVIAICSVTDHVVIKWYS